MKGRIPGAGYDTVYFYKEDDGRAPVLEWLKKLRDENRKAHAYCVARIRLLAEMGHEFYGDLTLPGCVRESMNSALGWAGLIIGIPDADLHRAIERKRRYEANPSAHCYLEVIGDA